MLPVLLLTYKRFDLLQRVIESVREYQPLEIYVSADGPKNKADEESCNKVKQLISKKIDWECNVHTKFNNENLGCGLAVSSAITWFFEHVDYGVIIEEDCLPSKDFFLYCEKLLLSHKHDNRVKHISGCNFTGHVEVFKDYGFSNFASIWGWATWKRAWIEYSYSFDFCSDDIHALLKSYLSNDYNQFNFWRNGLEYIKTTDYDSWDFQWQMSIWKNNGICIFPEKNLIQNIGFNVDALHTKNLSSPLANLKVYSIDTKKIKRKNKFKINSTFDDFIFYYVHKELFDLKFRDVKKYKIELEPTIFKKISNAKYSFRDKLYLIKEWLKQKNR